MIWPPRPQRELTLPERKLWHLLRDRRLAGIKFRRQVPIGPYIADVAATSRKLVIGLADHRDDVRDAYLASEGWAVMLFRNADLDENRDEALARIAGHIPAYR